MYEVKILTPEYKQRLDKFLEKLTEKHKGLEKEFEQLRWRNYINKILNNKESITDLEKAQNWLKEENLFPVQFTTETFEEAEELNEKRKSKK